MLEPLIVLTVLNCFFMLSSTVTTCALWWQYRSHRCCFKKCPPQTSRSDLKKSSSCSCRNLKQPTKSKLSGILNIINTNKTNTSVDNKTKGSKESKDKRDKRDKKKKSKMNQKYLSQFNKENADVRSANDFNERSTMSEASQTNHENKSTVVMEYSTVQKIVQVVDDDANLPVTGGPFKNMNPRKEATLDSDERKVNFDRGKEN